MSHGDSDDPEILERTCDAIRFGGEGDDDVMMCQTAEISTDGRGDERAIGDNMHVCRSSTILERGNTS